MVKTTKQNLHVIRADFSVLTVVKDEAFTKKGILRKHKSLRKLIADSLRFEGHRFLDTQTTDDIIDHATIEIEEVEVEDED